MRYRLMRRDALQGFEEDDRAKLDRLLAAQDKEARDRRIALFIAVGSAVFAAARLGVIAVPLIRKARVRTEG